MSQQKVATGVTDGGREDPTFPTIFNRLGSDVAGPAAIFPFSMQRTGFVWECLALNAAVSWRAALEPPQIWLWRKFKVTGL